MIVLKTVDELEAWRRNQRGTLGLVPTMGSLHAGHTALVELAIGECDTVLVTIFVNPAQFNDPADFGNYPRDDARDAKVLQDLGVHALFMPPELEIYPEGDATRVSVTGLSSLWEGAHRPGHFEGVATIVAKLFNLAKSDRAYFGEKDYQQLQIVKRMATDLHLPVSIVSCPIVRAEDGLALSSRNAMLNARSRAMAPGLNQSLHQVLSAINAGAAASTAISDAQTKLSDAGWDVDYLALIDGTTLNTIITQKHGARLIVAATIGGVRLIDNIAVG